jgi:exosortase/archaeosortase
MMRDLGPHYRIKEKRLTGQPGIDHSTVLYCALLYCSLLYCSLLYCWGVEQCKSQLSLSPSLSLLPLISLSLFPFSPYSSLGLYIMTQHSVTYSIVQQLATTDRTIRSGCSHRGGEGRAIDMKCSKTE